MPVNLGPAVVSALVVVAVVVGGTLLVRAGSRVGVPTRAAYRLLLGGLLSNAAGLAGAALLTALGGRPDAVSRLSVFAAGLGLGLLMLLAGLLRLPGASDQGPGARLRHTLDGGMIAACVLHVSWTLAIDPLHTRAAHGGRLGAPPAACMLIAAPVVIALSVVAITGVVMGRARRPRAALVLAGVALMATAGAGLATLVALRYAGPAVLLAAGTGYAVALLGVACAALRTDPAGTPETEAARHGWVPLALIPGSLAIVAAVIRVAWLGGTDNGSILFAAVVGGLLITRQAIAIRDARRYAARLADREAYFKDMAYTDALTGLGNRRQLLRVLHEQAAGGPPCVLLAIDLDGFKSVNDIRGHDVGDAVLTEVGRRLRGNLRPGDVAARLGGDEFAVLMWANPDEAQAVAERLLAVLARPFDMAGSSVFLSASIGLAGCATAETIAALLHNADLSLRFAKQRGKDRVERYDAAYDQWMRRRTVLEQELRGAIDREELSLAFQPVVALPGGLPVGVEALLRWRHPTLGQVSPGEFIPVAEESGQIDRLDRWVLHQACHQLSRWLSDGYELWMSVNISVRELHLPEYVAQVVEVLRAHRIPPGHLVLEVTEHAVALDIDEMVERLAALRTIGVRVALDDFGAGYSSLSQLGRLPVDILKIDHALLGESAAQPGDSAAPLVDVVVRLGHRLGLQVIAEGVADTDQRAVVEAAGCEMAQGDLFCRAVPAEHVEALLTETVPTLPAPRPAQHVGQVDSGHEMRQS